jgi:hypothetical protein
MQEKQNVRLPNITVPIPPPPPPVLEPYGRPAGDPHLGLHEDHQLMLDTILERIDPLQEGISHLDERIGHLEELLATMQEALARGTAA